MFKIKHIDHIVLRVKDVEASIAFYAHVLGCPLEKTQADIGLYQLRAGGSLIDLVSLDGELGRTGGKAPGKEGRNLHHFCLRVDPFDEAAISAHLGSHGVTCDAAHRRYGAEGYGLSLHVTDPDGNIVELKGPPE